MGDSEPRRTRHLSLDNLAVNPRLARRLPPALACLYHALPVAEDGSRITVAMADPDDAAAREAIETALGATCCVVRGDPVAIDALLAEIWSEEIPRSLRLLVCARIGPIADEVWNYAQAMGNLLGAHVGRFQMADDTDTTFDALLKETRLTDYDLVILGESDLSLVEQLLSAPMDHQVTDWAFSSLLLVRRPRWPLKKMLLVVQGEEIDDVVVDWAVRLARPSAATVTVLTWVLPTLAQHSREASAQQGLNALLTTDTALGQQMRRVSQRLVNWEIESTLRLYQGWPDQRIRREVVEGNYDLVAVATEPRGPSVKPKSPGQWPHHLVGELIASLLRQADQPVLIARPTTTLAEQGERLS